MVFSQTILLRPNTIKDSENEQNIFITIQLSGIKFLQATHLKFIKFH